MNKKEREEYTARVVEFFLASVKTNGAFDINAGESELLDGILLSICEEMMEEGRAVTQEFMLELSVMVGSLFRLFVRASGSNPEAASKVFSLYLREHALK